MVATLNKSEIKIYAISFKITRKKGSFLLETTLEGLGEKIPQQTFLGYVGFRIHSFLYFLC